MRTVAPAFLDRLARTLLVPLWLGVGCSPGDTTGEPVLDHVSVSPTTAAVEIGGSVDLVATGYDQAGAPMQVGVTTWSTSSPGVASVSTSGTVTGIAVGQAQITAKAGGKEASSEVTVIPRPTSTGTITVNGSQQFQRMTGWEALAQFGHVECDPRAYQTFKEGVLDRAANELGINRIRVGLRNGFENPIDRFPAHMAGALTFQQWQVYWFQVVNDNADPFVINPAGFTWGYLDYGMDELVVPLRQRLAARGEGLWLNISYTGASSGQLHRDSPEEYAEFLLAAFQHLQQRYGWVPNSFELVNEPDLGGWSPASVAQALLAAKRRLNQAGFFPDIVGPSATTATNSLQYFDQMAQVPGVTQALSEISYHRYGSPPTPTELQGFAQRAAQYGLRTAMLEHIGSGHEALHTDLTQANVSAWQQFGLAFCGDRDIGGTYFPIYGASLGNNSPDVRTGAMTKFLRQYFRYVGLNAVRVGASSTDARFAPVAFRNVNGKYVTVVKATGAGSFSVGGLPAGTYGIDYTTATEYMRALADVTITGSQAVTTSIPAAGVLTIFKK